MAFEFQILVTGFQCFSHLVIHTLLRVRVGLTSFFGIHWFHIFHNANTTSRALTATLEEAITYCACRCGTWSHFRKTNQSAIVGVQQGCTCFNFSCVCHADVGTVCHAHFLSLQVFSSVPFLPILFLISWLTDDWHAQKNHNGNFQHVQLILCG